jgi:hypothetical protein
LGLGWWVIFGPYSEYILSGWITILSSWITTGCPARHVRSKDGNFTARPSYDIQHEARPMVE